MSINDEEIKNYITQSDEFYIDTIIYSYRNKVDTDIPNGHADHAALLLMKFFDFAQSEVDIYSGSLYEGIFDAKDNLINSVMNFFRRSQTARLRIAYERNMPSETILDRRFIKTIISDPVANGRLEIWNASNYKKYDHFSVMDKIAYRHETDHKRRAAKANFGKPTRAIELYNVFENIISNSVKIYPISESIKA